MPPFAVYHVRVHSEVESDDEIELLAKTLDNVGLEDKLRAVAEQIQSDLQCRFPNLRIDVANTPGS
jgi:hypothetical protein